MTVKNWVERIGVLLLLLLFLAPFVSAEGIRATYIVHGYDFLVGSLIEPNYSSTFGSTFDFGEITEKEAGYEVLVSTTAWVMLCLCFFAGSLSFVLKGRWKDIILATLLLIFFITVLSFINQFDSFLLDSFSQGSAVTHIGLWLMLLVSGVLVVLNIMYIIRSFKGGGYEKIVSNEVDENLFDD